MRDFRIMIAIGLFLFAIAVFGQHQTDATDLDGLPVYGKFATVFLLIIIVWLILLPVINRIWPKR